MPRIRQNISTNSLFHFTNDITYLIDILENGFQARYCFENISFGNYKFAFPMKCFCDIPLSAIKFHLKEYGQYGIGIMEMVSLSMLVMRLLENHKLIFTPN